MTIFHGSRPSNAHEGYDEDRHGRNKPDQRHAGGEAGHPAEEQKSAGENYLRGKMRGLRRDIHVDFLRLGGKGSASVALVQAEHIIDQAQRAKQDRAGADDGRNDAGGEGPLERRRNHGDEQA